MSDKIELQENCRMLAMALRNLLGTMARSNIIVNLNEVAPLQQAIEQGNAALNNHSSWLLSER